THASAAEPSPLPPKAETPRAASEPLSPRGPAAPQGNGTLFYDLAAHAERGELLEGQTRVLDFGERAGDKYTLGGWMSGTGRSLRVDGQSALLVPDKVAKLALPADGPGAANLVLRARGFAASPLTVYVNGETLKDVQLGGRAFETVALPIRAGLLKAGENVLQLRVARTGPSPIGGAAGLALDWVRLGPPGAEPAQSAPVGLEALRVQPAQAGARASLQLPGDHSLGFAFEVPANAELRARLRAPANAKLTITALRDGAPPLVLLERAAGTAVQPVVVPLARLAGELVRLELRAQGGALTLEAPEVVTLDGSGESLPAPKLRNVLVILVDTLRADKLEAYRPDTRVKTPGLHAFLNGAAVMRNARSQENWTKPSVATLLSSLLPWQHQAVTGDARVPDSVELLPELLRDRGFYTGAFIANGYVSDKFGFKQGWNTYRNYIREGRRTPAQYVAADVLQWLDERDKDKPFFLYVHTIDPHVPYKPPASFLSMYDDQPYGGPVDFRATNELLEKIKIGSMKLNERDKVHLQALYDAEISYHDVHFAALMQALEQRGLARDTAVAIVSDHGEEFWDHGSVGHGHSVYDELLHVPMILRLPGLTEHKQRSTQAVGLVDVMPTLLEAIGQPVPEGLSGRSFLSELRGQGSSAPRAAVSGFMGAWRTIGVGRWKLTQRTADNLWLYDVEADPGETRDLAAERPITLRYLRGMLGLSLEGQDEGSKKTVAAAKTHKSERVAIDKKTEAELRALGYVGTSRPQ
ncbi:MAG TPA: sulfatase, partial [Polyangiales bacterium]|nr:sulfatase [Polyangiales bacterium]